MQKHIASARKHTASALKVLLFDIETAPSKAYIWGLWQETKSYSFIETDWFVLCWSAKWLGSKEIISSSLPVHKGYKDNPENDKPLLEALWKLLDEADVVIAHNGRKFDRKKVNARFLIHGMPPPSPYVVIDTLEVARREFAFTSNRLNDLGIMLGVGKKVDTGGFGLWKKCLEGDLKAWERMTKYCNGDISLLEAVYFKLRPYIKNHPNLGIDSDRCACPKCGSGKIQYRGYMYSNSGKYKRFQCQVCGGWGRDRVNLIDITKKMNGKVSA